MPKYEIANDPVFKAQQGKGRKSMQMYLAQTRAKGLEASVYEVTVCVQRKDGAPLTPDELDACERAFPVARASAPTARATKPARKPAAKRKAAKKLGRDA